MAVLLRQLAFVFVLPAIYSDWWEDNTDKVGYSKYLRRIADYPHIVAMVDISQPSESLVCVGLHIGKTQSNLGVVLTAGSCVYLLEKNHIRQNSTVIRSNSEHWNCRCGLTEEYKIQEWRLHLQYAEYDIPFVGKFSENDVGLLVIDDEWRGAYNMFAEVHPLNMPVSWKMGDIQIIGWGFEKTAVKTLQELRVGETLTIISADICRERYYTEFFPVNSYCIQQSVEPNIIKSCNYDNGGPVIIAGNNTEGTFEYKVVGMIVETSRCNNFSKPTIVVNASKYEKFITDFTWVKSNKLIHDGKKDQQGHEHKNDENNSQDNNESNHHGNNDDDHLDDSKENNSNENNHKEDNDDDHLDDSKENNGGDGTPDRPNGVNNHEEDDEEDNEDDHLDNAIENEEDDPAHRDDNDGEHLDDSKENNGANDKSGDNYLETFAETQPDAPVAGIALQPNKKNAAVKYSRKTSKYSHHRHVAVSNRPNTGNAKTKHTFTGYLKKGNFAEHGVATWTHKYVTGWKNEGYEAAKRLRLYGIKEGGDTLQGKRACYPTPSGWQRCWNG